MAVYLKAAELAGKTAELKAVNEELGIVEKTAAFDAEKTQYSRRNIRGNSGTEYGIGVYLDSDSLVGLSEDESIKKDEVIMQGNTENGVTQYTRSSDIRLADLLSNVNAGDRNRKRNRHHKWNQRGCFRNRFHFSKWNRQMELRGCFWTGTIYQDVTGKCHHRGVFSAGDICF